MSNNQVTVTKRITEKDIEEVVNNCNGDFLMDALVDIMDKYYLQTLKDRQAEEVNYEIIQPKQLNQ